MEQEIRFESMNLRDRANTTKITSICICSFDKVRKTLLDTEKCKNFYTRKQFQNQKFKNTRLSYLLAQYVKSSSNDIL